MKRGNARGGKGPWFRVLREERTSRRLAMSLTPEATKLEELRGKLYSKAKTDGSARFGYVEVHRDLGVVEIRSLLRSNAPNEICPRAGCGKTARPVR